jgi:hypothetical protein
VSTQYTGEIDLGCDYCFLGREHTEQDHKEQLALNWPDDKTNLSKNRRAHNER